MHIDGLVLVARFRKLTNFYVSISVMKIREHAKAIDWSSKH
jgi:hypothetical protein